MKRADFADKKALPQTPQTTHKLSLWKLRKLPQTLATQRGEPPLKGVPQFVAMGCDSELMANRPRANRGESVNTQKPTTNGRALEAIGESAKNSKLAKNDALIAILQKLRIPDAIDWPEVLRDLQRLRIPPPVTAKAIGISRTALCTYLSHNVEPSHRSGLALLAAWSAATGRPADQAPRKLSRFSQANGLTIRETTNRDRS